MWKDDKSIHSNGRFIGAPRIDLMNDDVTLPEMQYGSCSHAQVQDERQ